MASLFDAVRVANPTLASSSDDELRQLVIGRPKGSSSDFVRGLSNFVPQAQGMLGATKALAGEGIRRTLGEGVVSDYLTQSGLDSMAAAKKKQVHKDTDEFDVAAKKGLGALVTDWAPYQLGQFAGNMGEMALTAGLGVAAGRVAPGVFTGVGRKAMTDLIQQQAMKRGAQTGLGLAAAQHGLGEVGGSAIDELGVQNLDFGKVLPAAAGHAGLEYVGDMVAAKALKGVGGVKRVEGEGIAKTLARNVGVNALPAAGKEFATEAVQTGLERYGAEKSLDTPDAYREYLNAGMAGGLSGGFAGTVGGVKDTFFPGTGEKKSIYDRIADAGGKAGDIAPKVESKVKQFFNGKLEPKKDEDYGRLLAEPPDTTGLDPDQTIEVTTQDDNAKIMAATNYAKKILARGQDESYKVSDTELAAAQTFIGALQQGRSPTNAMLEFRSVLDQERKYRDANDSWKAAAEAVSGKERKGNAQTPDFGDPKFVSQRQQTDDFGNVAKTEMRDFQDQIGRDPDLTERKGQESVTAEQAERANARSGEVEKSDARSSQMIDRIMSLVQQQVGQNSEKLAHTKDDDDVVLAKRAVGQWVKQGFQIDGKFTIPKKFVEALGEDAGRIIVSSYDLMRQQGLVEGKKGEAAQVLNVARRIDNMVNDDKGSLSLVLDSFTPLYRADLGGREAQAAEAKQVKSALDHWRAQGAQKLSKEVVDEMKTMFGPNFNKVINAFKNRGVQQLNQEQMEESGIAGERYDEDGNDDGLDYNESVEMDDVGAKVEFHGDKGNVAFRPANEDSKRAMEKLKVRLKNDGNVVKEVGVIDEVLDGLTYDGPNTAAKKYAEKMKQEWIDELIEQYKDLTDGLSRDEAINALNRNVRKLRVEAFDDGTDRLEVKPRDIASFRDQTVDMKKVNQAVASGMNKKQAFDKHRHSLATVDQGRIFLETKDGSEFVTSTSKLLAWANKGKHKSTQYGAKEVAEKVFNSLSALVTSDNGFTGRMRVKNTDGTFGEWIGKNDAEALVEYVASPKDRRHKLNAVSEFEGNERRTKSLANAKRQDGGNLPQELPLLFDEKTTLNDAGHKSEPTKRARNKVKKELRVDDFGNYIPTVESWSDRLTRADFENMTDWELEDYIAKNAQKLESIRNGAGKRATWSSETIEVYEAIKDNIAEAKDILNGERDPKNQIEQGDRRTSLDEDIEPGKVINRDLQLNDGSVATPEPTGALVTGNTGTKNSPVAVRKRIAVKDLTEEQHRDLLIKYAKKPGGLGANPLPETVSTTEIIGKERLPRPVPEHIQRTNGQGTATNHQVTDDMGNRVKVETNVATGKNQLRQAPGKLPQKETKQQPTVVKETPATTVQLKWIIDNMRASIDDFIAAVNKLPAVRRNAMMRAMTQVDELQATDKRLKMLGVKPDKLKELKRVTQLVLKTLQGAEKTAEQMKQSNAAQKERERSDEAMRSRAIDLQRKGKGQPLEGEVDPNYSKDEKVGAGETVEDADGGVDKHYRNQIKTELPVESKPVWALFKDDGDGNPTTLIGWTTNLDAAQYVSEQDDLVMVNEMSGNLKKANKQSAQSTEPTRRGNAMSVKIHNDLGKEGIAATHDSPIRHEGKFDWRKNKGKGEGNASFGAGTYLSTADGVHRSYKNKFSVKGGNVAEYLTNARQYDLDWVADEYTADQLKREADEIREEDGDSSFMLRLADEIDALAKVVVIGERVFDESTDKPSPTYEVTVNAKPEELLDWDAPLSEQSELVKKALKNHSVAIEPWEQQWNFYGASVSDGSSVNIEEEPGYSEDPPIFSASHGKTKIGEFESLKEAKDGVVEYLKAKGLRIEEVASGADYYRSLTDKLGSKAKASDYLQSLGIVGHKYAANGGRNDKFPNYVIYDDSRIETNYVHFNKQSAQSTEAASSLSKAEQDKIRADIHKRLGPDIAVDFKDMILSPDGSTEWSGDWVDKMIGISLGARSPDGVARHESMHQLFKWLRDSGSDEVRKLLENIATNPAIRSQLEAKLSDDPHAIKQLDDAEEAAAYLFQFRNEINLGDKTKGFFNKLMKLLNTAYNKVMAYVFGDIEAANELQLKADLRRAESILGMFDDGAFAGGDMKTLKDFNDQLTKQREKDTASFLKALGESKFLQKAVFTAYTVLEDSGNPYFQRIAREFATKEGGKMMGKLALLEATAKVRSQKLNVLNELLKDYSNEEVATALKYLQEGDDERNIHAPKIQKLVVGIRDHLEDMYKYMQQKEMKRWNAETKKWVPIPEIKRNYWPQVWDIQNVMDNQQKFIDLLKKHHMDELKSIAAEANDEAARREPHGEFSASETKMKREPYENRPITVDDVAQSIVERIITSSGAAEINESTSDLGITPYAKAVNRRSLWWVDKKVFREFQEQDAVQILTNYTVQVVKRGEYVQRFGNEGEKLTKLTHMAYAEALLGKGGGEQAEATYKEQMDNWLAMPPEIREDVPKPTIKVVAEEELRKRLTHKLLPEDLFNGVLIKDKKAYDEAYDKAFEESKDATEQKIKETLKAIQNPVKAIMAGEGTIGRDISPTARKVISGITTFQNMRLMMLSLFSSMVDPLGMVVRGGELNDAWKGMVRGVREIRLSYGGKFSNDAAAKLAEYLGTVDAGTYLDALGQTYSSLFMQGKMHKINNAIFKWNGMEGWNRAMRIQATQAAIGFIKKHLNEGGEHSMRYLKDELGLDPKDKDAFFLTEDLKDSQGNVIGQKGDLNFADERIQNATMRWVDGAILRPNAMQRPILASDPHYLLFYHLKQFAYSFHKTILRRAYVEAKHGNYTPVMALVGTYVPVMIAADAAKELLAPGDEPAWMKGGLDEYIRHGISRANLFGIPQFGYDAYHSPLDNPRRTLESAAGMFGPMPGQAMQLILAPVNDKDFVQDTVNQLPGAVIWNRMAK